MIETNFRRLALPLVAFAVAAGCVSKEFTYRTRIAGGQVMNFTIVAGRTQLAEEDGVKILEAATRPDDERKKLVYSFRFSDASATRTWQSVRVEDVTEDAPILIHEDLQPKLVDRQWSALTRKFDADDPALRWVFYVNDSVRIYRFTMTATDGRKIVLYQATMVPAFIKGAIRSMYGEKY